MRAEVWALVRHDLDGAYFGEACGAGNQPFPSLARYRSALYRLNFEQGLTTFPVSLITKAALLQPFFVKNKAALFRVAA